MDGPENFELAVNDTLEFTSGLNNYPATKRERF